MREGRRKGERREREKSLFLPILATEIPSREREGGRRESERKEREEEKGEGKEERKREIFPPPLRTHARVQERGEGEEKREREGKK